MSRVSKESVIAFVTGWLLGRSRRGSGMSILLRLAGALSCLMALSVQFSAKTPFLLCCTTDDYEPSLACPRWLILLTGIIC